jgi:HSP20 family protein
MADKHGQNIKVTENAAASKGKVVKSASPMVQHPIFDVERAFDRFFGRGFPSLWRGRDFPTIDSLLGDNLFELGGQRLPNLDVVDRNDEVLVRAEVPGVEKKDLNITLTDNILTIKGESRSEQKTEEGDYHKREISSSSFARTLTLPATVDASKAVASLKDGVLDITLPKVESSKKRKIAVK